MVRGGQDVVVLKQLRLSSFGGSVGYERVIDVIEGTLYHQYRVSRSL